MKACVLKDECLCMLEKAKGLNEQIETNDRRLFAGAYLGRRSIKS